MNFSIHITQEKKAGKKRNINILIEYLKIKESIE